MECKDVEWAAFLFNAIGEDESYIIRLDKVQGGIKGKQSLDNEVVGKIVNFLNEWRSRANKKVVSQSIKEWYNEMINKLAALPLSLADLDDNNAESIKEIYSSLKHKSGIGDTIASKVLHIIKPHLFVPWDIPIKSWYDSQLNNKDYKTMEPAEKYLSFLKKMQEEAKYLLSQNPNFLNDLNSKVLKLYEGNLEQARNNELKLNGNSNKSIKEKIDNYTKMVEFMRTTGKTLAKYLDEYNWITITNNVKIKPEWHPD